MHQKGELGERGWRYYKRTWEFEFPRHIKAIKQAKFRERLIDNLISLRFPAANIYNASELKAVEDVKKLFHGYESWSDDQIKKTIKELTEELNSDDNVAFLKNYDEWKFKREPENMAERTSTLELAAPSFADDALRYNLLKLKESLPEKTRYTSVFTHAKELDSYMRELDGRIFYLKERLHSRGISKNTQVEVRDKFETKIGYGAAGLGAAIMLALDKSIWGYDERQVGKHWNQIFVENEDFKGTRAVKDVMFILQALARRV